MKEVCVCVRERDRKKYLLESEIFARIIKTIIFMKRSIGCEICGVIFFLCIALSYVCLLDIGKNRRNSEEHTEESESALASVSGAD